MIGRLRRIVASGKGDQFEIDSDGASLRFGVTACGDGGATCGLGTHEEGGVCIADPVTPTECGTGTVLMAGECVPDGSVVCQQGTVFDTASGTCIVDPSACADGTTLVGSECVPDDELLPVALELAGRAAEMGEGDERSGHARTLGRAGVR